MWTDGRTGLTNMLSVFSAFAKAPYNLRRFTSDRINVDISRHTRWLVRAEGQVRWHNSIARKTELFQISFILAAAHIKSRFPKYYYGPGRSVGIATTLRTGRSGDRIPVWARFSAPIQTGPVAHPASCTMGTRSFPGVKSGRGVMLTPQPLLVPWSWKSRAIPLLRTACTRVHFTFTFS